MSPFPSKLEELKLGWRLDALDGHGGWYAATVVEVRELRADHDLDHIDHLMFTY